MGIKERKERERERRKQQIIVAAKRVFSDRGFNRATMEDIAREAELSPGTLYLYFKNKEELYASLSVGILQYINIRMEHVVTTAATDPQEKLARLIEAMFDVYEFDPLTIINMLHLQSSDSLKNLSPELITQLQDLSRKSMEAIALVFEEGIKAGLFIKKHPMEMADIFWSLFSGIVVRETGKKIMNPKKDYLKSTLTTAFHIFSQGIQRG